MGSGPTQPLNLQAGELVEVRSVDEILATLDEKGRLNAMPFMPEMLQYCGKRFRVHKVAHKTCDNIQPWNMRTVKDAVHLTGLRCDGQAHGGCDAGCLIFWHEAWLKRAEEAIVKDSQIADCGLAIPISPVPSESISGIPVPELLQRASIEGKDPSTGEDIYSCQATDLREFTSHLSSWNLWQYVRDIRSRNLDRGLGDSKGERFLELLLGIIDVFRILLIEVFNKLQSARSGVQYPHVRALPAAALSGELSLKPGEFVQVKSRQEIFATLDKRNRNRGLLFDAEMLKYCGGTFRVLKRVNQIVDEKNGKMLRMKSSCIILDGSACAADYHKLCPRAIYHYWREGWLRRVG
ncbi:MAG TPA: hypothetical protein VJO16_12035 [Candidatus Acidoferrum sp.]|nr:hypothetical protein [Candidatus Acidoferrum sp.]